MHGFSVGSVVATFQIGRMFAKYPKMGEDCAGTIGAAVVRGAWVTTEKIHGANLSLVVEHRAGDASCAASKQLRVRIAKRSGFVTATEDFYAVESSGLARELKRCARRLFRSCEQTMASLVRLQIYGELYGGSYANASVPHIPGITAVQAGVHYSPGLHFMAFDVAVTADDDEPRFADFDDARALCEAAGFTFVEALLRGTLAECLAQPVEFSSTIGQRLGWPPLESGDPNLAEGLVVRPAREPRRKQKRGRGAVQRSAAGAAEERGGRGVFKRKIAAFSERRYDNPHWRAARSGGGGGGSSGGGDDALTLTRFEMLACVNAQRLHSVLSKSGVILDGRSVAANKATLRELKVDVIDALQPDERALLAASMALQRELHNTARVVISEHVRRTRRAAAPVLASAGSDAPPDLRTRRQLSYEGRSILADALSPRPKPDLAPRAVEQPPADPAARSMTKKELAAAKKRQRGRAKRAPRLLILTGLPGSGKSTFASHLCCGKGSPWARICQDELGSFDACAAAASKALRVGRRVVIDRCNPTPEERARWLELSFLAPRDAAVVFFDADAELCTRRVAARVGHPTIPTGTGRKAVEHFRKRLVPPNAAEGFRAIYIVGSAGDSSALVYQLGGA